MIAECIYELLVATNGTHVLDGWGRIGARPYLRYHDDKWRCLSYMGANPDPQEITVNDPKELIDRLFSDTTGRIVHVSESPFSDQ